MRLAILKRSGVAGVTSVILAGVLAVGLAQNASAKANPPNAEARTLEGTWWVQVTALTDCVSHVPLMSFTALLTFAKGGTMTGTTTNPAFAIGQRSPDHGVWFRNRAAHTLHSLERGPALVRDVAEFPRHSRVPGRLPPPQPGNRRDRSRPFHQRRRQRVLRRRR